MHVQPQFDLDMAQSDDLVTKVPRAAGASTTNGECQLLTESEKMFRKQKHDHTTFLSKFCTQIGND